MYPWDTYKIAIAIPITNSFTTFVNIEFTKILLDSLNPISENKIKPAETIKANIAEI